MTIYDGNDIVLWAVVCQVRSDEMCADQVLGCSNSAHRNGCSNSAHQELAGRLGQLDAGSRCVNRAGV